MCIVYNAIYKDYILFPVPATSRSAPTSLPTQLHACSFALLKTKTMEFD